MRQKTNQLLGDINKKILKDGQKPPLVRLKNGMEVRTGTIATFIHNIALYNASDSHEARRQLEEEFQAAIPVLFEVGLFDLFPVSEWLDSLNAGKHKVGLLARDYQQHQAGTVHKGFF